MRRTSDHDYAVIRASLKNPAAFETIFERHFDAVFRYVSLRVARAQAEDIASETFVIAFRRRSQFRSCPSALPWLVGIAHNVTNRSMHLEARWHELLCRHLDATPSSQRVFSASLDGMEIEAELVVALNELSGVDRETFLMRVWDDLTYEDIAVALDVPVGTVRSRINRPRLLLQAALDRKDNQQRAETT